MIATDTQGGNSVTQNLVIRVDGTNDNPVISHISSKTVDEGQPVIQGQITSTDVDHGDTAKFSTPYNHAGFTLNTDGSYSLDPSDKSFDHLAVGEHETLIIPVIATDTQGGNSVSQNLVIRVDGTNDNPVISHITSKIVDEGQPVIKGQITSTDVDHGDTAKFSTPYNHAGFTLNPDGSYTLDPSDKSFDHLAVGEHEALIIPVIATDTQGGNSVSQNLVIRVEGTNDNPIITFTDQGGDHTHGTLSNIDVDTTDTHTYAVSGASTAGTTQTIIGQFGDLVLDTDTGKYTYTQHPSVLGMSLDANGVYHGKEFFEVSTSDNHGGTSTKYLTFEPNMLVSAPAKDGDPAILTPKLNQAPQLLDHQPAIPAILSPTNKLGPLDIDPLTDTGSSNTDGITRIDTPTVTGHTDIPFSVVTLTDENGKVVATTTSNEHGDFSVALSQLSGSISGEAHAISGHAIAPSSTNTVDTTAPLDLIIDSGITAPTISLTDGTMGNSVNPNIMISATEITHADISGQIDHTGVKTELTALTVTDQAGTIATLDANNVVVDATGHFELKDVDLSKYGLVDGTLTVHATATDLAGNTATQISTATLDTQPGTIAIDGHLGGDNVINAQETQSPLTVSGTTKDIEAGQEVTIDLNGKQYHTIVGAGGVWTTDIPQVDVANLPDGKDPIITATVTDQAGNPATPATHQLHIDTHIDPTTVILTDGGIGGDGVINSHEKTHAQITGTIDPTAILTVVTITDGTKTITVPLSSVMTSPDGHFTATNVDLSSLKDGQLTVTATAVDPAGNESSSTDQVLMDTAPPIAPTINPIPLGHDKTPTITGTAEAGSTLTFTDIGGNFIGTAIASTTDGSFTFTPPKDLPDGGQIIATATDTHGNISAPKTTNTNIDTHIDPTAVGITDGTQGSTDHPNDLIDADELHHVSISGTIDHSNHPATLTELTVTDSNGKQVKVDLALANLDGQGGFTVSHLDLSGKGLADGELTVQATAKDTAGNISIGTGTATLDTHIDQTQVSLTDAGNNPDGVINASEKMHAQVTGSIDPSATLTDLTITDGTHTVVIPVANVAVTSSGHFIVTDVDLTSLMDGQLTVTATAVDPAGNESSSTDQVLMDTAPPVAPTINPIPIGHDKTPTITGTAEAGSTLTFTDIGGNFIGTAIASTTDGSFTFTPPKDLPDGGQITATATDTHGNTSALTTTDTNIDTHIDPTTVGMTDGTPGTQEHPNNLIDADELRDVSISGTMDHSGHPATLTELTVIDSMGNKVKVDPSLAHLDGNGGFTVEHLDLSGKGLVDGELKVEATATDTAGNSDKGTGTATLDTHIDPTQVRLTDGVGSHFDGVINASEQAHALVTGDIDPTATLTKLTISDGSTTIDIPATSVAVAQNGHFTVADVDLSTLKDGQLTVTATAVDPAGNESTNTCDTLKDTQVTAPLSVTFEGAGTDKIYNISEVGSDQTVTAIIALPTDAIVGDTLTINGNPLLLTAQNIQDKNVHFEVLPNTPVTASITDQAGNQSPNTLAPALGSDLNAPFTPVLFPIPNAAHNKDNTPTITGITEPGATVEIFIDGNSAGTVSANPHGSFTYTPPTGLPDGDHSFTAIAKDPAGNPSPLSTPQTTTIDTTPPAQIGIALTTDSGLPTDLVTNTGDLTLTGEETGAHTQYSVDGTIWSNSFTPIEGKQTVYVKQTDVAGNESKPSQLTFTLDTQVAAPKVALVTDSGSSHIDFITNDGRLDVTGTEPGAHIEYSVDSGKTWVDQIGKQVDGQYTVLVRQTDVAGNVSGHTAISYTLDTKTTGDVKIADTSGGAFHGDQFLNQYEIDHNENTISGHIEVTGTLTKLVISDPYHNEVVVDLNQVNLHQQDGSFDISGVDLSHLSDGKLTVTAASQDVAGNTQSSTATLYKDTYNTATDVIDTVKEDDITTVSGHIYMESDAHGGSSTAVAGSLSGDIVGTYGTLTLNSDGSYTYNLHNSDPAVQALGKDVQITDTLIYNTIDPAGNEKESHLIVTITGTNDAATISGVHTGGATEDVSPDAAHLLKVDGQLTIADIDTNTNIAGGEAQFTTTVTPAASAQNWGSLSIDKTGHWQYQVDNDKAELQALQQNDTHTDSFVVHSVDGTEQTITVTVTGTKDTPTIQVNNGADSGAVIEQGTKPDGSQIVGVATATGHLIGHDVDTGDTQHWTIDGATSSTSVGTYGHLSVDDTGHWTYTLDDNNQATQELTQGQAVSESFVVRVTDSTGLFSDQKVTVNITGSNDRAQISGTDTGTVKEDTNIASGHNLHTTGKLSITDLDAGESHFQALTLLAGQNGHVGTLNIDNDGQWHYLVDNSLQAVQELKDTDHIDDVFTVLAADGTEHTISIRINGTNHLPEIIKGQGDTGRVIEAGSHANDHHTKVPDARQATVSGILQATDEDKGDPAHWAVTNTLGQYGELQIDQTTGKWVYTLNNQKADSLHQGEVVTETFTVTDTDSSNTPVSHEVVITITGSNDVPVITGEHTGSVAEDGGTNNALKGHSSISGGLIATDPDNNDGTLTWSIDGAASSAPTTLKGTYGTLTIEQDGKWHYVLDNNDPDTQALQKGDLPKDTFSVLVTDSSGKAVKQAVAIEVHGSNDDPILAAYTDQTFAEDSGHSHHQTIALPKVSDVDDQTFTYSIDDHLDPKQGNHRWINIDSHSGVITVNTNAKLLQSLAVGEHREEQVLVTASDEHGGTTQQAVTITITGTNDAPRLERIQNIKLDNSVVHPASQPMHSARHQIPSLTVNEDSHLTGKVIFTDADYHGVANAEHTSPDTHTFSATVKYTDEHAQTQTLSLQDSGFIIHDDGSFEFDASASIYQHLQAGQTAHLDVSVTVTDGQNASDTNHLHFAIQGGNDAPTATQINPIEVDEDTSLHFTLGGTGDSNWGKPLLTISDVENDKLDVSNPHIDAKYGQLIDHGMGRFEFIPAKDQNFDTFGKVPVTFGIDDNHGGVVKETGYIHVNPVNDNPTSGVVTLPAIDEDHAAITITEQQLLATSLDIDNSHADLHISGLTLSDPSAGKLSGDSQNGWIFTPTKDWNSHKAGHNLHFDFTVTDGAGGTVQSHAVQVINPVQDPAVISVDTTKTQDTSVKDGSGDDLKASGDLSIVDPDLGENSFAVTSTIAGKHGFASIDANGHWEYTLNPKDPMVLALGKGEQLPDPDQFAVHSIDGTEYIIHIEITGKNEAPVVTGVDKLQAVEDGNIVHGQIHVTDTDTSDHLSFSAVGTLPQGFTLGKDGSYSFDPSHGYEDLAEGQKKPITATVRISDGQGGIVDQDIAITVTGTNDKPIASGVPLASVFVDKPDGTPVAASVTFSDKDFLDRAIDYDTLDTLSIGKLTAGTSGQHQLTDVHLHDSSVGSLRQDGQGGYTFTPAKGFLGHVEIDYTVTDGHVSVPMHTSFDVKRHVPPQTPHATPQLPTTSSHTSSPHSVPMTSIIPAQVIDFDDFGSDTKATIKEDGGTVSGKVHETHTGPHPHQDQVWGANHKEPEPHADGSSSYGYMTVHPDGTWTYHLKPHGGETDPVNQLSEGQSLQETFVIHSDYGKTSVIVTIEGTNDDPIFTGTMSHVADKAFQFVSGRIAEVDTTHIEGTVTATDVDNGDTLSFSEGAISSGVDKLFLDANGHLKGLTVNPNDGSFTFTPDSQAYGSIPEGQTQTFQVPIVVTDGNGGSDTQIIELSVKGHNRAPIVLHPDLTVPDQREDFGQITLTTQDLLQKAGASDPDGDALHITQLHITGQNGQIITVQDDGHGNFIFHSKANLNGDVHVSYQVTDGMAHSQTVNATLTVLAVNDVPVVSGFNLPSVAESTTNTVTPSSVFTEADFLKHATDVDIATDGDTLHLDGTPTLAQADVNKGTIEAINHGWRFVPNDADFNGRVHIEYTVTDKAGTSAHAVATLQVTPTNDPAIITNPKPDFTIEDGKATASGQLGITDVDGHNEESFVANSHMGGTFGYLELDAQGNWIYNMTRGDKAGVQQLSDGGKYTETFHVTSKDGTHYDLKVEIHGTNDNPVLHAISAKSGNEGASQISGTITATDIDAQGHHTTDNPADILTYTASHSPAGFVLNSATGAYSLDLKDPSFEHLAQGQTQTLTTPITVTDNHGGSSSTKNLVITVTGTNDVPVLDHIAEINANEDDSVVHGKLSSTDVDSDNLNGSHTTYHIDGGATVAGFTLKDDGSYTFNPHAYNALQDGETKDIEIPIIARDNHGDSSVEKLVIHLTGTNDVAKITGTNKGSITDSNAVSSSTATGQQTLHVTDPDHNENSFIADSHIAPATTYPSQSGLQHTAYGHLSITKDGQWQYHVDDPDAVKAIPHGKHVTETFTVHSADNTPHTITVTLQGRNEAATFSGDIRGTIIDGSHSQVAGNLVITDVDHGETGLAIEALNVAPHSTRTNAHGQKAGVSTSPYGHLDINQHGHWSYQVDHTDQLQTIPEGATVTETFVVHAKDGTSQNITITLTGTNDAPTVSAAVNLSEHATEDMSHTFSKADLLAHAHDVDSGDQLHLANPVVDATMGAVSVNNNGDLVFTPAANFNGDVSVTYDVVDGHGGSVTTTATFMVDAVNDIATITGVDTGAVIEDTDVHASGVLTIADVDTGENHFKTGNASGRFGTLHLHSNGHWTYDLATGHQQIQSLHQGETATDTVTVTSADGQTTHDVVITITGTNDAPTVSGGVTLTQSVKEDGVVTLDKDQLLSHALDVDSGDQSHLTVQNITALHGHITVAANGDIQYQPNHNYHGSETFTYDVMDSTGAKVQTHALMTVASVNDVPVVSQAVTLPSTDEDHTTAFAVSDLLKGATDADSDKLRVFQNDVTADNGQVRYDNQQHKFVYTPDANFHGTDTLHYKIADGHGGKVSQTATLDVVSVNDAPTVASAVHLAARVEDTPVVLTRQQLLANATDADGDHLDISGLSADHGTVTQSSHGHWKFVPESDYHGPVVFSYQIDDGNGGHVDQTATMTVTPENDPANIAHRFTDMVDNAGNPMTVGRLSISDADGPNEELFKVESGLQGQYGELEMFADGQFRYTLTQPQKPDVQHIPVGTSITDTITVHSVDGTAFDVDVKISGSNHGPVVTQHQPIALTTQAHHQFDASDFSFQDNDNDALDHITITTLPTHGELMFDGQAVTTNQQIDTADIGKLQFNAGLHDAGTVSFGYTVSDGHVDSAPSSMTMDVLDFTASNPASPVPVSADEPQIETPVETVTLESLAVHDDTSHTGAQAYLAQLGVDSIEVDTATVPAQHADLDLVLGQLPSVVLDDHGIVVVDAQVDKSVADSTDTDDKNQLDEIDHHDGSIIDMHDWSDHHG
ncbi:hypothetical protein A9264_13305 [Vibrio sp. UCD-FRSSP16_10]|uniref:VCBS domain-containing protein n=1 Tax=unclassified Vibrio TaxID=2614977 RepID=UPI000800EC9A|nr:MULTISPECIES: VCBS domain-containing protein [unclassified Vibrio]OBT20598.1 hypothetical protein A9264_13305 [Vibrio sp. UCD-FRSSP16_10]